MPRRSGSRRRSNLVERNDSAALERLQHRVMLSSTGIFPIADPVESLGEELRQVALERLASQAGSLQSAGVVVEQIDRTIEITGSDEADSVQVSLDATGNLRVSIQHDNVSDDFFFATDGVAELMFRGNAGDDYFMNTTSVPLSAFGGPGNDTILGGFGRDRLRGGSGDDLLKGDPDARSSAAVTPSQENDDTLLGGGGDDRLWGRSGDDRIYGGSGNDRLVGGRGSDTLSGNAGDDFIDGRSGDDALFGGASNDIIIGGSGSDRLRGGIGRDLLIGGLDSDHLTGQSGQDIVIGGFTSFDNSLAALRRISSAFVAESHYFVRVLQLSDPDFVASLVLDQSVHDDQAADVLLGGTGRDWFFRPRNPCFEEEQAEQFPDLLRDEALNDFIPAAGRDPESLHSSSATHGAMALVPVDEVTDVATRNGPWLDPTTWEGNAVPVIGARVWIPTGLTVSIDGLVGQAAASVRVDGVLQLPQDMPLPEVFTSLREGRWLAKGKKLLVVLDQFEQWLHAQHGESRSQLIDALRQCDGSRVQCIVMARDDFWLAVSRFMNKLEVDLVQGQNTALVDLFDLRHAKSVLAAFGRAFGTITDNPNDVTKDQNSFLDQSVGELQQDGKIICVRLALFAEMVKGKSWTPASLKEVGGTSGVGLTFLEETFSAQTAHPKHRLHQKSARGVLKALLPESDSNIKGHMRSYDELLEASGYAQRPRDFDELIGILDRELRLITPTDPEGVELDGGVLDASVSGSMAPNPTEDAGGSPRYYHLTHDYLVPSLREWLTRKQRETS